MKKPNELRGIGFSFPMISLKMKLTMVFSMLSFIQIYATSHSRKTEITLDLVNTKVSDVIYKIESETEFKFLFNEHAIDMDRSVTMSAQKLDVNQVLKRLFAGTNVIFKVFDTRIILQNDIGKNKGLGSNPGLHGDDLPQFSITGKVLDQSNLPLIGANIVEKGTSNGTQTDFDGNFALNVTSENATLIVSYVGFTTKETPVDGQSSLNIILEESAAGLDEVVVIGYGNVKKSDLTGSVASVDSQDVNAIPASNVLQSLSGRAAGVNISQNTGSPGAEMSIRIRGINSIQGGNEPLYVINGFPTNQSMLLSLNSSDIQSVEILKDASATAIYGSRGANGVVIITTKKGLNRKTQIDFETSTGVQTLRKKLDLMNATEYAAFVNRSLVNSGLDPYFTDDEINNFGEGFDWQDAVFRSAPINKVSLNINGGNDRTQFSIGGSIIAQDGILKRSSYDRYSTVLNINHKISDKLSVEVSNILSYIDAERRDPEGGNRGDGIIGGALSAPPTVTPKTPEGDYVDLRNVYPFMSNSLSNPINEIYENSNKEKENRVLSNAALTYNPIPELTIKISGGIASNDGQSTEYLTNEFIRSPSSAQIISRRYRSLLNENTIDYSKTIGNHRFSALVGFTYQDFVNTLLRGSGQGFISDVPEVFDLGAADNPGIPFSSYSKSTLLSGLSRLNYVYKDKYLATFTFRTDGASQYSAGDKWGYFPSGALAWRVSNEDFFDLSYVSNLKLRASWGISGNQAIGPYTTLTTLESGIKSFGDDLRVTYAPGTRLPNNLKWETTDTKNFGIDLGLFNNRLNVTADYYVKKTSDLLNTVGLPLSMGYTTTIRNIGEMQNKGFELGIEAFPITGDFTWNFNLNFSANKNKVLELYNDQDIFGGFVAVNLVNDNVSILRENLPVGSFWGYLEDGYDEEGQIIFQDLNGDGSITLDDKTIIGDPNPDFIYGFQSNMSYKNFDFTFFFQGSYGNDIFNASSIGNTLDYGIGLNMPRDVYNNHWTPDNTNPKYPIPMLSTNVRPSDRFVEDGSYLRLKNIELAYNLNLETNFIKKLRIFVSGQNLLTFTKYSWWDPEVNSRGSAINQGIDHYSYPTAKIFTVGLQSKF
jgi:TonB-linked SusC/RagA family outer membrane protein